MAWIPSFKSIMSDPSRSTRLQAHKFCLRFGERHGKSLLLGNYYNLENLKCFKWNTKVISISDLSSPDMWEFRGFAEFRGPPRHLGCSCDLCKSEEKISALMGRGGGCSVAPLYQSNEVQLYLLSSRGLFDWRKAWLQLKCHNLTLRNCHLD